VLMQVEKAARRHQSRVASHNVWGCENIRNECFFYSLMVLQTLLPVSRPASAADPQQNRWAAVDSSTKSPPAPSLTHSSDATLITHLQFHPKPCVVCVSDQPVILSYTSDVGEPLCFVFSVLSRTVTILPCIHIFICRRVGT
jgi:hypothetical protein